VIRLLIDALLRRLARLRPKIRAQAAPLKVNLGGGIEVAAGWINADGSLHALLAGAPRPLLSFLYRRTHNVRRLLDEDEYVRRLRDHRFVFCDFDRGLPFETGSVDFVFCSHVLEHFEPDAAARLVRETLRVLKPGGWARLCVPDLAHAVRRYQAGAKREALQYFYTGERSQYDQHRYMYDDELLCDLLRAQGFEAVTPRRYREGEVPDLEVLDNRPDETLYVEGRKPLAALDALRH
jgi:SAM-dependent methyltransferase